jgi:tetratricopeptide (TPR) repeat protein
MSNNIKEKSEATGIENVESALTRAEQFIEDNQKIITIVFIVIVVVVGGFFGFKKFYLAPQEKEAQEQMFRAEQYFEQDSFKLALNGDGNNFGFIKIIDEYGLTKSANLSHYYAGISYLNIGKFNEAIEQLKKFDGDDNIVSSVALGATGDAYIELGKKDEAVKYYLKAAKNNDNDFSSPIYLMKAGNVYQNKGEFKEALEVYNTIKEKYPKSYEGRQIDKYITFVELKIGQ